MKNVPKPLAGFAVKPSEVSILGFHPPFKLKRKNFAVITAPGFLNSYQKPCRCFGPLFQCALTSADTLEDRGMDIEKQQHQFTRTKSKLL